MRTNFHLHDYNLSTVNIQQLLNRVKQGKGFKPSSNAIRKLLTDYSDQPTWIRKTIDILQQMDYLTWPINYQDIKSFANRPCGDLKTNLPSIYKALILNNYIPKQGTQLYEAFKSMTDIKKIWHYINRLEEVPMCTQCHTAYTHWSNYMGRYTLFCSNKCRALNDEVNEKRKNTCIVRYGHDKLFNQPEALQQTRISLQQNYGVQYPFCNQTLLTKANDCNNPQYRLTQLQKTFHNKYNVDNIGQLRWNDEATSNKARDKFIKNWLPIRLATFENQYQPLFNVDQFINVKQKYPWKCLTCNTIFDSTLENGTVPRCPSCYPLNSIHFLQNQLAQYCKTLDASIICNTRSIIPPLELDIFSEQQMFAIEFNGLYWHSEYGSNGNIDRNYHLNKSIQCNQKNVKLMHVFEDHWLNKQPIIKSMIANQFKSNNTIGARLCSVVKLDAGEANQFFDSTHLQGGLRRSTMICYALVRNDQIVAAMSFGKPRFSKRAQWELLRFSSKLFTNVSGGGSKLLTAFEREYSPKSLISYADRSHSAGGLYQKLLFERSHDTKPGYSYVNIKEGCTKRFNRMQFQKHKLTSKLKIFDVNLTELQNMKNNNFSRIWDCGQSVYTKYY